MSKPFIKCGFYALLFTLVWTLLEHVLGYNTTNHEVGQFTRMIGGFAYYLFIILAVYQTRKQQGSLRFVQGLKAGSGTAFIYSIGVSVIYCVYGELINTQYKPTLMAFERAKMVANNTPAGEIETQMKMVDLSTGGSVTSYLGLFCFMFIVGFVVSLIAALIFQRKPRA